MERVLFCFSVSCLFCEYLCENTKCSENLSPNVACFMKIWEVSFIMKHAFKCQYKSLHKVLHSRLLRTSSPIWSTSLHPDHNIILLIQCVIIIHVDFHAIPLICDAMPISFF
jgi:hypothetical protein